MIIIIGFVIIKIYVKFVVFCNFIEE